MYLLRRVVLVGFGPDGPTDVVDQDVDASEALQCGIYCILGTFERLEVRGHRMGTLQRCRDVVNQFSSIHKRDGTTFCGNSFGNAAPDPLSRSGDDHDPVVEPAGEESRAHDATLCRASVMARCIVDLACSLCWTIRSRAVARSFCSNARTIRE